jgi:putative Holliday junction resolvase
MAPAALPAAASAPAVFLAFDPGTRRVGVASGNSLTRSATPLATLPAADEPRLLDAIGRLVAEWGPAALVVGVPRHPDGAAHNGTKRARRFATALERRFGLPVHGVDERYSTVEAAAGGARNVDAAAAAILLEQFLAERP